MRYESPFDLRPDVELTAIPPVDGPMPAFVLHDRRQAAVGQGGFHIGALRLRTTARIGHEGPALRFGEADFLYVYDCGAEPKRNVEREIGALVATRSRNRRMDILFVSHFDRDHICGIPRLLDRRRGLEVETVVMPFINMAERIFALAKASHETLLEGDELDRRFVDIVIDPASVAYEMGARRVILIGRGGEGPDGEDALPPTEGPLPQSLPEEREGRRLGWKMAPHAPSRLPGFRQIRLPDGRSCEVVSEADFLVMNRLGAAFWKLSPYVRPTPAGQIGAFKDAVERSFGWPAGAFDAQVAHPAVVRQMVNANRTRLARAYAEVFGDKNLTSLCLYSGPREPAELDAWPLRPRRRACPDTRIGWFGTGDAHLRAPADIADFARHYGADLAEASTFLLPHHGSIENSDPGRLISQADDFVASADPIHDWLHPHPQLVTAVVRHGASFRHVRSRPGTSFDESFLILPRDPATNFVFTRAGIEPRRLIWLIRRGFTRRRR